MDAAKDFDDWLYFFSFMASLSHHYFQIASAFLWGVDFSVKLITLILAMLGVIVAVQEQKGRRPKAAPLSPVQLKGIPTDSGRLTICWVSLVNWLKSSARRLRLWGRFSEDWTTAMRLSCWSALFAAVMVLAPFSAWYSSNDTMMKQWAALRADIANLRTDFMQDKAHVVTPCLAERRKQIEQEVAALDREEPFVFPPLKRYCERAQRIRNGETPESKPVRLNQPITGSDAKGAAATAQRDTAASNQD